MSLYKCIITNQWGGKLYAKGYIYELTSPPATWFVAISDEWANGIKVSDTPLPAWKDAQGDWHIPDPVNFDGQVSFDNGWATSTPLIVSGDITLLNSNYVVECTATLSVTLPSAASVAGRFYQIKSTHDNAGTVTIVGTIDGDVNPTLIAGECFTIYSNGTAWRLL